MLQAAQAMEVVLQAIARSDGTRASVVRELHGDPGPRRLLAIRLRSLRRHDPGRVAILRVTGTTPPSLQLPAKFQGAVVDRVVTVPAEPLGLSSPAIEARSVATVRKPRRS